MGMATIIAVYVAGLVMGFMVAQSSPGRAIYFRVIAQYLLQILRRIRWMSGEMKEGPRVYFYVDLPDGRYAQTTIFVEPALAEAALAEVAKGEAIEKRNGKPRIDLSFGIREPADV